MDNEALGYNFEHHFNGEEDCEYLSDQLKSLVPFSFIITVIVLIYSQYDCVQENE